MCRHPCCRPREGSNCRDNAGSDQVFGRRLEFDPKSEHFVSDREANRLLTRNYRSPFVVPDKV